MSDGGDERIHMMKEPKEHLLFSSFLLLFVIHSNQVGIGILGFQRIIVQAAGHDAWISVLLAGIACHLTAWIMLKTLNEYRSLDLYGLHEQIFGKWLGCFLSSTYIAFMLMGAVIVLRNYIEVVQAWMFPELPTWVLTFILLSLAVYAILGGIRVVVGVCFLSVVLTIWMFLTFFYPLQYGEWRALFPMMEAGVMELLQGAKQMSLTVIGFEILYFVYPFLKEKEKAPRYTHIGLLITTVSYVIIMMVSTMYFSEGQMMTTIWATLSLWKIIQLPNIERFEYIGISLWMLVIIPNVILYLWAATRGMKVGFHWKQKNALFLFSIVIFLACICLETRQQINQLNNFSGKYSIYIVFVYPFFLYAVAWFRKHLGGRVGGRHS